MEMRHEGLLSSPDHVEFRSKGFQVAGEENSRSRTLILTSRQSLDLANFFHGLLPARGPAESVPVCTGVIVVRGLG